MSNTDWLDWTWLDWTGSMLAIALLVSSFMLIGILVWKNHCKPEN